MKVQFRWNYNGNDVKLAGSFNNWHFIDMPNKMIELDLDYGIYEYKFFVDNQWMYDMTKPTVYNMYGSKNNLISINDGNFTITHLSDTHSKFLKNIGSGDILIHTGDFSIDGHPGEYQQFNEWLGMQKYLYKIVVLGNHDLDYTIREQKLDPIKLAKERLSNCIVLNNEMINLYGYNLYGIPWYYQHNWNYSYKNGFQQSNEYQDLPSKIDILLTHGPPAGYLDICGSNLLTIEIMKIKPKYHLFGHIHQKYGSIEQFWYDNTSTIFVNSSLVDETSEKIINYPHLIKLQIKA
jgi:Icc-related predicted phosphoesterase